MTTVRPAKFADIPRLYALLHEGYERSKYREHVSILEKDTKALLMQAIQRHGLKAPGGMCAFVAENSAGTVEGLIVGTLNRVYFIGSKLMAQDVFLYTTPLAHPASASRLVDAFLAWAFGNEAVFEAMVSATNIIGDPERVEKLYRRKGFAKCGAIYERRVER